MNSESVRGDDIFFFFQGERETRETRRDAMWCWSSTVEIQQGGAVIFGEIRTSLVFFLCLQDSFSIGYTLFLFFF